MLPNHWFRLSSFELAQLSPIQEIRLPGLERSKIKTFLKRDDLLHANYGGNKAYKLLEYAKCLEACESGQAIVTFGGGWSNHLLATATLGHQLGIPTCGVVRGNYSKNLTATLRDCLSHNMHLVFISQSSYAEKHSHDAAEQISKLLPDGFQDALWIPEGGASQQGAEGCIGIAAGILNQAAFPVSHIVHACGTATTLGGMVAGADRASVKVGLHGIAVLKADESLQQNVEQLSQELGGASTFTIHQQYHCGGYAKYPDYLHDFVLAFEDLNDIQLDPVYTAKMCYAVRELIQLKKAFKPDDNVILVHSGGLQGRRGFAQLANGDYS